MNIERMAYAAHKATEELGRGLRTFVGASWTAKQTQAEIQAAISRAQIESLKSAQIGGQAGQDQLLNVVTRLTQATEAKLDARIGVLERENAMTAKKIAGPRERKRGSSPGFGGTESPGQRNGK